MGKNEFFKYFVNSKNDIETGFYIENVGNSVVPAGTEYPYKHHPASHYFKWEKGRFLKEYQILFISKGKGIFESRHGGKYELIPGSLYLLYPHEWHRYRPLTSTGWEEFWVGFNGKFAGNMISGSFFSIKEPVVYLKNILPIQSLFEDIISFGKEERPGYQQIIAGLVLQVLGQIQFSFRSRNFIGKPIEDKINKARVLLNESINSPVDFKAIAMKLNISYSLFRKRFKEYTGISPKQYYLQLKTKRAQDLLLNTSSSIKNIAFESGFENIYYFSKAFKEKTGHSPSDFRKSRIYTLKE